MSNQRHFTTRRGFVGAMGFGALGLYATWAAYGASPLPFGSTADAPADPHAGHAATGSGHAGHADPAVAETHGGSAVSPADFERRHAAFLDAFRQADGSIRPTVVASAPEVSGSEPTGHDDHAGHAAMPMDGGHGGREVAMPGMSHGGGEPSGHAGHAMPMEHGASAGHGAPAADAHAGHGAAAPLVPLAVAAAPTEAPIEVYLLAGRFSFEPDDLRLERGRAYRFHMMASDVAHGASIAFGRASRIVRLRPQTVTTLDLTFREAGRHLVYCTVYCGPGHDGMRGSITVA